MVADKIVTPEIAVEKATALIMDWHKEHVIGIYLNTRYVPTKIELISLGGVDKSYAHPREIFRPALVNHAVKLIVLHNHPSGEPDPSDADLKLAERLKKAGEFLQIPLVDFIIFTEDGKIFSFGKQKIMPRTRP